MAPAKCKDPVCEILFLVRSALKRERQPGIALGPAKADGLRRGAQASVAILVSWLRFLPNIADFVRNENSARFPDWRLSAWVG
jgi:hypothetical protein